MAAALMSLTMVAGTNDLLWDYSEAKIPTSGEDRNLHYGAYVNDAPSTNLGLNGVKMNSSGYAYFTKAAVAGKLKLTFGPRKSGNSLKLAVWTWTGDSAMAQTLIGETTSSSEYRTEIIDLTAEQTNIYITRPSGTGEGVLQKIEFKENVARTFVDFKIEFRDNPFTVLLPEGGVLPQGVEVDGTNYNGGQHGVYGGYIAVQVDGPVKFTIGACQHSNTPINIKKDGQPFTTFSNNAACGEQKPNYNQYVTYTYTGEAALLTFELAGNTYVPYFFAEATEITPCEITFKDQNGTTLGKVETIEGATLEAIPYTEADLPAIAEGNKFRGWFYTSGKKAQVGDPINGNTTIQAKVTPLEVATVGSVQTYDFASAIFYPEDHETVEVTNGKYHNNHGWIFTADGSIKVEVAGNAIVVVTLCTYSESGDVAVYAGETELAKKAVVKESTPDGAELIAKYKGEPTTLTIKWTDKQYIHKVMVYNVLDFVEKDEKTGYYMVPAGDAASFLLALVQANGEGNAKIFLPNGTYDLGEAVLTAISGNNISIIGQSMEQTIIKNKAITPGIGATATLLIEKNVKNTYLQDLTLQNLFDYYKTNEGVAVALQDKGTQTICKNVKMLSYQDTYYSNLIGAVKYFETSEIHGTVDFICGDGSVYFYDTELVCEQRSTNGGGQDALTASNADASDKGYVFEHCTVKYAENIEGTKPVVSFGRAWNNKPKTIFLNTFLDDSNGKLNMYKDASAQKDKISRWTLGGMNTLPECFGEYNSVNAAGETVSPASNNVTFVLNSNEKQMETILTAEQAATYTMGYTLGNWAETAKADAAQAVCEKEAFAPEGIYLIEAEDGKCAVMLGSDIEVLPVNSTIRKANARGGFGPAAGEDPEGIENAKVSNEGKTVKTFRNGQLIIVRDNKTYNVLGAQL